MTEDLRAAVAAGVLGADEAHRALLQSVVDTARAIFGARAASIFLFDEEADELVFEAVAGEGEGALVGRRFPSSTGIAGWTLTTRQALVVDDLESDPRHARDAAQATGYAPKSLMSVPLLADEDALGVLQVLDRDEAKPFTLEEMNLLGVFGAQAAIALDLLRRSRRARAALEGADETAALTARVAAALDGLEGAKRESALQLLRALDEILAR